jgi:hypothetical protein
MDGFRRKWHGMAYHCFNLFSSSPSDERDGHGIALVNENELTTEASRLVEKSRTSWEVLQKWQYDKNRKT